MLLQAGGSLKGMESMEIQLKKAEKKQYEEVADLIQAVWERVENKAWFSKESKEEIVEALEAERSIAYVAVEAEGQRLAGIFTIAFPGTDESNLGRDLGMEEEKLPYVAHMDYAAILPEYRGNHLQYQLMQMGEEELQIIGYRYLMCTVHPDNRYSMKNVLQQGYQVMKTKEKYGGLIRNILLKEL